MLSTDHPTARRTALLAWSLLFIPLAATGLLLTVLFAIALGLSSIWIGLPIAVMLSPLIRTLADTHRRTLGRFLDEGPIPTPYGPQDGLLKRLRATGHVAWRDMSLSQRIRTTLSSTAIWRDLAWLLLNGTVGVLLGALPALLVVYGVYLVLHALVLWRFVPLFGLEFFDDQANALLTLVPAALLLALFWFFGSAMVRGYARLGRWLLAPTEKERLTARVAQLATSRADTIDAQASEVRRIERDLHDGAQARLVALGMSLGMAEEMLARDPDMARRMLSEARETTREALTELRDLVRGIHPPVLVERGLDGAVRALAITQQLPISVDIDLPGRPADPVESAAYFAVVEVLTNAAKHSGAERAWVRINYGRDRMVILVGDDGRGGADFSKGTGLQGIRRRLAAFDGTISVVSPTGGPTIVTMELPCALSSPKTSPSSEKA
ncbi:sensor histidine kinase [Nocardiopsis composta]|uniref:histidine kinase n=1 Tax=Nocardiopsis composta TaxID=157465 RepID=A0A7W8QHF0_9ACTN|nr:sensor histidine kinase [Nocardiopsis composta]MBB5430310.1 signal transduction histidine kinase [Nocardiopsis composta]